MVMTLNLGFNLANLVVKNKNPFVKFQPKKKRFPMEKMTQIRQF
jgi:hypothetical protein